MKKVTEASLTSPKIKWLVEPTFDDDGVQRSAGLDEFGREHLDPVPMSPPVGLSVAVGDTLHDTLRRLLRDELFRQQVEDEGFESFEEAEDFDVEDDYFPVDPKTPWEAVFDPPADGGGTSARLASDAPNGKGGPAEPPTQPSSDQKVSEGSSSELSMEKTVEKPIGVPSGSIDKGVRPGSRGSRTL